MLCGHTLPMLAMSTPLATSQFAYYGLRDVDAVELERVREHRMHVVRSGSTLVEWMSRFDKIHVSYDASCLAHAPAGGAPTFADLHHIFDLVRTSRKLIAVDVVELNPLQQVEPPHLLTDALKSLLL